MKLIILKARTLRETCFNPLLHLHRALFNPEPTKEESLPWFLRDDEKTEPRPTEIKFIPKK